MEDILTVTVAPLKLERVPELVVAHNKDALPHLEWELRGLRKGDIEGLFAVLKNHFPSSANTVVTNPNGGEEQKSKRPKTDERWSEQITLWLSQLTPLERLPPEMLVLIWDSLLFDDRWILGTIMYEQRPKAGHFALEWFHIELSRSLGQQFFDPSIQEATYLEDGAVAVLSTLSEFIYDLRDPLRKPFSKEEKSWFAQGGNIDAGLRYSTHYPKEYMTILVERVGYVLHELAQQQFQGTLTKVLTRLTHRKISHVRLFDQLAIFLDGYPKEVLAPWDTWAASWQHVLLFMDMSFFERDISLDEEIIGKCPSDLFLQVVLASSLEASSIENATAKTYSEQYAQRRLKQSFVPYDLMYRYGMVTFQALPDDQTRHVNVIQFLFRDLGETAGLPADWAPLYTMGTRLGIVTNEWYTKGNNDLHLYASAFGPHDMKIITARGVMPRADVPVVEGIPPEMMTIRLRDARQISLQIDQERATTIVINALTVQADLTNRETAQEEIDDESNAQFVKYMWKQVKQLPHLPFEYMVWTTASARLRFAQVVLGDQRTKLPGVFLTRMFAVVPTRFSYLKEAMLIAHRDGLWIGEGTFYTNEHWIETVSLFQLSRDHLLDLLWKQGDAPLDTTVIPMSSYGLEPHTWASILTASNPVYYQAKSEAGTAKVLYLKQSLIEGQDGQVENSPMAHIVADVMENGAYNPEISHMARDWPSLREGAEWGPNPHSPERPLPAKAKALWMMWMMYHVNTLRPETLILFALHRFDTRVHQMPDELEGEHSIDFQIWRWRPCKNSVEKLFDDYVNLATTGEQLQIRKMFKPFSAYSVPPSNLKDRVIKARAALENTIHPTADSKMSELARMLQLMPLNRLLNIHAQFNDIFWTDLATETGWEKAAWPRSIFKDSRHIELTLA